MRTAALLACLAGTAFADTPMTLSDCETGWQTARDLLFFGGMPAPLQDQFGETAPAERLTLQLTEDGWCRMLRRGAHVERRFDWQAEGIAAFAADGTPPLALRLRGTDHPEPNDNYKKHDYVMALRRVPGTGQLLLESLTLSTLDGVEVAALTALMTGAFFDSLNNAVSSVGGVTLAQMAGRLTLDPDATIIPQDDMRTMVTDLLSGLDDTQLLAGSRAALVALNDALPDATGTVTFNAVSDNGLGWLQVMNARRNADAAKRDEIIGFALSGVVLSVDWAPE